MTSRNRASCMPTNKGKSTFQRHIEALFTITHVSRVVHSLVLAHRSSRLCPESFFQQSPCRELFRLEAQVTRPFKSSRHPSIPPNICLIAAFYFPRNGCRKLLNRHAPLCATKTFSNGFLLLELSWRKTSDTTEPCRKMQKVWPLYCFQRVYHARRTCMVIDSSTFMFTILAREQCKGSTVCVYSENSRWLSFRGAKVRASIVVERLRTAGRVLRSSGLQHALHNAFWHALATRSSSRCAKHWSAVRGRKLRLEAGHPKRLPTILILPVTIQWCRVRNSCSVMLTRFLSQRGAFPIFLGQSFDAPGCFCTNYRFLDASKPPLCHNARGAAFLPPLLLTLGFVQ